MVSALTVSSVTSLVSGHFHIKSKATPTRCCGVGDVFTTRHNGPSTLTALGERFPVVLALSIAATGAVDKCPSLALSSLLDSVGQSAANAEYFPLNH